MDEETRRRKRGRETGKEGRRDDRMESDEQMSENIWRKKQVCISLFDVLFFSLVDLLLRVRGEGGAQDVGGWDGGTGRSKVIVVFVCFCVSASYQLLSGDGSLSRCMAALWCFMLSRYSC